MKRIRTLFTVQQRLYQFPAEPAVSSIFPRPLSGLVWSSVRGRQSVGSVARRPGLRRGQY